MVYDFEGLRTYRLCHCLDDYLKSFINEFLRHLMPERPNHKQIWLCKFQLILSHVCQKGEIMATKSLIQ